MDIERIVVDPDMIVTALQQKYVESSPDTPAIRVSADDGTELFLHGDGFGQPDDDAVHLRPERFVGDIDLPDPDADLNDDEIETLAERLGSEVQPELVEEVDLNADRDGDERLISVDYPNVDP